MSGKNTEKTELRSALWQSTWEKAEVNQTTLPSKSPSSGTASQTLAKMLPEKPLNSYAKTITVGFLKQQKYPHLEEKTSGPVRERSYRG
jgi:hypothetical protein